MYNVVMEDAADAVRSAYQASSAKRRCDRIFLWIYPPSLIAVQAVYAYLYAHSTSLPQAILVPMLYRLVVWTLPVLVYLAAAKRDLLDHLGLKHLWRGLAWGVGGGAALFLLNVVAAYATAKHVKLNLHFGVGLWLGPVATVGFSEEIVFRGFLLPMFSERIRFWLANLVQAALFLAIHIPGWILLQQFVWPNIARTISYVFVMGFVLGWTRKWTGTLWSCMAIHSVSNFTAFALR